MRFLGARRAVLLVAALGCSPLSNAAAITSTDRGLTARAVPLVTGPIDEGNRVVLAGNTRGEALRPDFDRGRLDDSYPLDGIQIQLKRSPEHEQAAEALADSLQRAGDPQFHHWLTAEQYAEQFGVANEDIAAVTTWLTSHGFTVHDPSPSRMTIDFSGTAGQVREAFGTEMHALEVKGVQHISNVSDPQIPAALAPVIEGIVSLHDFRPHPLLEAHKSQYSFTAAGFQFFDVVPADLATIYNFNPLFSAGITGQGQTIVLIEDSDVYDSTDWKTFRKKFGLDAYQATFKTTHPGNCTDPGLNPNGDDIESIVDAEWASASAPSADLQLAACASTSTNFGGLIAIQNILNQRTVPGILSFSFGGCEGENGATANAAYKAAYQQAVLEGVSVFVAAGDNGAAICDNQDTGPVASGITVNGLASTVYDVAVGGTDFADTFAGTNANYWSETNRPNHESALSYIPEIPWNDTCASQLISEYLGYSTPYGVDGFCGSAFGISEFLIPSAGSGGPSNCARGESATDAGVANGTCKGWAKPSWQSVLGNPQDGVRDLPDVSLFAADGVWFHSYVYCNSDPVTGTPCTGAPKNWSQGGGTSFATPILAGTQALVNQVWGGSQGNPAPSFYALASAEYGKHGKAACDSSADGGPSANCTFYDVTLGDNDVDCTGPYNCFDPDADQGIAGTLSLSDKSYQPTFTTSIGWDFATGIGTINATNLVLDPIWLEGCGF